MGIFWDKLFLRIPNICTKSPMGVGGGTSEDQVSTKYFYVAIESINEFL